MLTNVLPSIPSVEGLSLEYGRRSDLIREAVVRRACAMFCQLLFPRARKTYGGITAKKLSQWRQTGGAFGDICVVMEQNPEKAQHIAALFQGHADAVTAQRRLSLFIAAREETVADSADDLPEMEALNNPEDPEALQSAIDACDEVLAKTRGLRIALVQQLEDVTNRK